MTYVVSEKKMYFYSAYGLGIHSELMIPELVQMDSSADVKIHIIFDGNLDPYRTTNAIEKRWDLDLNFESATFFVEDVGAFLITDGNRIVILPAPGYSEQIIRLYLLGTVMSILLYQRKLLVLHGSIVEINQRAAIFLGASGAGKSTTTAALFASGHRILADDIAAIDPKKSPMMAAAGSPQIKVGPEVAKSLGFEVESLHELHPFEKKRGYRFHKDFSLDALPIQHLYVLGFGEKISAIPLKSQDAVIELIRHSRPTTLQFCGGIPHFLQCVQLAKAFPVYRLERPHSLDMLPEFSKFVEAHMQNQKPQLSAA